MRRTGVWRLEKTGTDTIFSKVTNPIVHRKEKMVSGPVFSCRRRAFPLCLLLSISLTASLAGQSQIPDPAFARWLSKTKDFRYEELAGRFLKACGRDSAAYQKAMETLARNFRTALKKQGNPATPRERCRALQEFFFRQQGFAADLDLERLDNLYPDAILRRQRGYCLGLSLVLLHLGEKVGWPLQAAAAPRHTFIRYGVGTSPLNMETTLGGELHDDAWYTERFDLSGQGRVRLETLSPRQTGAHLLNNHGYVLLNEGRGAEESAMP